MSGEEKKAGEEGCDDFSIRDKLEYQFNLAFFDEDAPLTHGLTIAEAANVRGIMTSCLDEGRAMTNPELTTMDQFYAKMDNEHPTARSEMMDSPFADASSFVPRKEVGSLDKPFRYRKMARVGVLIAPEEVTFLIGKDKYHGTLWPKNDQPPAGSETDGCFVGRLYFKVAVVDDDGCELEYKNEDGVVVPVIVEAFYEGDLHRRDKQPFGAGSLCVLADHGAWRELVRGQWDRECLFLEDSPTMGGVKGVDMRELVMRWYEHQRSRSGWSTGSNRDCSTKKSNAGPVGQQDIKWVHPNAKLTPVTSTRVPRISTNKR